MHKILSPRYIALVCIMLFISAVPLSAQIISDKSSRSYTTGKVFLFLGDARCGLLKSYSGGNISSEVIDEPSGPDYFVRKHIGQPKYEDARFEIGFGMSKGLYDWIATSLNMNYERKDVFVAFLDSSLKPKSQVAFYQALLTELTIPECDTSASEQAYMGITIAPEDIKTAGTSTLSVGEINSDQKIWLPSNFELVIDGLDCTRVSMIDSFTIIQTPVTDDIGETRDYMKEPGKLEFPNLRITIPAASAQTWKQWFDSFVIQGNNDQIYEKSGHLDLLSPRKESVLARISFKNLGIFKLGLEGDNYVAELYCEEMDFGFGLSPSFFSGPSGSTIATRSLTTGGTSPAVESSQGTSAGQAAITGIWDVTMGNEANHHIYMYQEGGKISGVLDDRLMIAGSMNGNVYTGKYFSTVDPTGNAITMTVASDGSSLIGTYHRSTKDFELRGIKDTEKIAQITATPTMATPSPGFTGTWGTSGGDILLKVDDTKVTGTWGDITIQGAVNGNVLNGRYYKTSYPELLWDFNMTMKPDGKTGVIFHTKQGGVFTPTWRK